MKTKFILLYILIIYCSSLIENIHVKRWPSWHFWASHESFDHLKVALAVTKLTQNTFRSNILLGQLIEPFGFQVSKVVWKSVINETQTSKKQHGETFIIIYLFLRGDWPILVSIFQSAYNIYLDRNGCSS